MKSFNVMFYNRNKRNYHFTQNSSNKYKWVFSDEGGGEKRGEDERKQKYRRGKEREERQVKQ